MAFKLVISVMAALISFQQGYAASCLPGATCGHALTMFGEPKYEQNFTHLDYVNPDAPKGGEIRFAQIGTFDSLNKYILKGVPAAGLGGIYDALMTSSADEPFSQYGLLAGQVAVADDNSFVAYQLRREARWHDGKPVTPEDVVFTFNTLVSDGHPLFRSYYGEVDRVEALPDGWVKFHFSNTENRELPYIMGELPIIPKHYYGDVDFTKTTLTPPLGSGPYKIAKLDAGKSIAYERVADYWGKDLPVNRGRYNFGTMVYDYYRDATVAIEALKAGEYDIRQENISKNWSNAYNIPQVADGRMVKEAIPHSMPAGIQAFVFNTRKAKFSDPRVRQALGYTFDFEWSNKNLFYDAYYRTDSFFENSMFDSEGLPSEAELKLLEPYRDILPESIFTEEYKVPVNDGSGNNRKNLLVASKLLDDAGWVVKGGKRVQASTGTPMVIEFLINSQTYERVIAPMVKAMKKLGIEASIRIVDAAQYIKRQEEFDFDIVMEVFGQSNAPGNEQVDYWHSSRADVPGSRNIIGVRHKAVDAMIDHIIKAQTLEELTAATRALDRVLLHHHYVIPMLHGRTFRMIYWNKFGQPATRPDYGIGVDTWWIDESKAGFQAGR